METQAQVDQRLTAERHALVAAALAQSLERFEVFGYMNAPELPPDATDSMQVQLCRWQVSRFGLQSDERYALGIIEEVGETFEAEEAGDAIDGLGDVCVYSSQLCTNNRLALGPILDLARVFQARGEVQPLLGVGKLAHCVLKHAQKIRGQANQEVYRLKLVETIALCVAKALDDCEIMHELKVHSTPEVFRIVGVEVMSRGAGHVAIPASFVEPEKTELMIAARPEAMPVGGGDWPAERAAIADAIRRDGALVVLQHGIDQLAEAERVEGVGDWDLTDVVNHDRLCSQCGGLLSESAVSDVLVCSNGHEHKVTTLLDTSP